jgi:hypothetical protein
MPVFDGRPASYSSALDAISRNGGSVMIETTVTTLWGGTFVEAELSVCGSCIQLLANGEINDEYHGNRFAAALLKRIGD